MMMFMQDGVEMKTIFGDGSAAQSGLLGKLESAVRYLGIEDNDALMISEQMEI